MFLIAAFNPCLAVSPAATLAAPLAPEVKGNAIAAPQFVKSVSAPANISPVNPKFSAKPCASYL